MVELVDLQHERKWEDDEDVNDADAWLLGTVRATEEVYPIDHTVPRGQDEY